jgi:hypothetical protein
MSTDENTSSEKTVRVSATDSTLSVGHLTAKKHRRRGWFRRHASKRDVALLVMGALISAIVTRFIPYLWDVTIARYEAHSQAELEMSHIDQEVSARLSYFSRQLISGGSAFSLELKKVFLNPANVDDNAAWVYGELQHKSLTDLIWSLIALEPSRSRREQLRGALTSVVICQRNFEDAIRSNDLEGPTIVVTNRPFTTPPVGFVTAPDGRILFQTGRYEISITELLALNLERWHKPFDDYFARANSEALSPSNAITVILVSQPEDPSNAIMLSYSVFGSNDLTRIKSNGTIIMTTTITVTNSPVNKHPN